MRCHWGYVLADMIKQSACLAINRGQAGGREEITRELMDEVILDHWSTLEYAELHEVQDRKARADRQRAKARNRAATAKRTGR